MSNALTLCLCVCSSPKNRTGARLAFPRAILHQESQAWEHCSALRLWNDCSKRCFFVMRCTQAIIYYGFRNQTLKKYLKKTLHCTDHAWLRSQESEESFLKLVIRFRIFDVWWETSIIFLFQQLFFRWRSVFDPTVGENKSSPPIGSF